MWQYVIYLTTLLYLFFLKVKTNPACNLDFNPSLAFSLKLKCQYFEIFIEQLFKFIGTRTFSIACFVSIAKTCILWTSQILQIISVKYSCFCKLWNLFKYFYLHILCIMSETSFLYIIVVQALTNTYKLSICFSLLFLTVFCQYFRVQPQYYTFVY